ncbi:threonine--tRNA ligase like protein [Verticillium longisporum]|uniref:Threonine--tRNA ligase like protein n=1 Tax=Verticillium longisporum TaxID=100787 RepID=A0A8I2Z8F4_VERLO|nr:threonine--tRNA ligase like protein [Verticillium longisporum]
MTSVYSPGSPIFLPNGARIFNRLVDFLRRQYVSYGFEEVITPNIYKKSLWEVSGHLQNYADDMYTVTSRARQPEATSCCGDREPPTATNDGSSRLAEGEDDDYGLKPMNCPGHCLIFASKARSYRDLPIRYADFSPLHRNEVSGALSGLTRVRRFHQDDGHVFCRPVQIQPEVFRTLAFMKSVYGALGLGDGYAFALSTRPADHYIGTDAEWTRAEAQLRGALEQAGLAYTAGTIQLDFQLPQRFGLEYSAPAPALEARGVPLADADPALRETYGPVTPVLIHRAILGSVERLMALLIEEYNGRWPFWLNPRQAAILTLNDTDPVVDWAAQVQRTLLGVEDEGGADAGLSQPHPTGFTVDVDVSTRPLGEKLAEARAKAYGMILVVGKQNVEQGTVTLNSRDAATRSREDLTPTDLLRRMKELVDKYQ